jgi:hypothetical protein
MNKNFIKYWSRAENLSLEIYQEISNLSGPTDNKKELKKYEKLKKKINKLNNLNDEIIISLFMELNGGKEIDKRKKEYR